MALTEKELRKMFERDARFYGTPHDHYMIPHPKPREVGQAIVDNDTAELWRKYVRAHGLDPDKL